MSDEISWLLGIRFKCDNNFTVQFISIVRIFLSEMPPGKQLRLQTAQLFPQIWAANVLKYWLNFIWMCKKCIKTRDKLDDRWIVAIHFRAFSASSHRVFFYSRKFIQYGLFWRTHIFKMQTKHLNLTNGTRHDYLKAFRSLTV